MKRILPLFLLPLLTFTLLACGSDTDNPNSTSGNNSNTTSHQPTKTSSVIIDATASKASSLLCEERTFANNVWNSQTPEVFEINITDPDAYYTITFSVAIDTAVYRYEDFPFYANIFTPDGAHRHLSPQFPVKQYGRWKGEMRNGYRVITKQLYEYFPFSKAGKQRIEVKQATSQFNLEGIHAFAIDIKKADLDFEKMRNQN